jgi:hypothetical protein
MDSPFKGIGSGARQSGPDRALNLGDVRALNLGEGPKPYA